MATPYPATPAPARRKRGGVVGPLVLIFLGCVFLLQNAGYLPPNFWLNLWRLWPVILVLAGLELLLGGRIPWLLLAGLSAVVLVGGAVVINNAGRLGPTAEPISRESAIDLGSAQQAAVTIRFDAGQLNIASLESPAPAQLAAWHYAGPAELVPQPKYAQSGDVGRLDFSTEDGANGPHLPYAGGSSSTPKLDLALNSSVPLTSLSIKSGASQAHLDLSAFRLSDFDASVGAASAWIRVPQAGATNVRLSGGASEITIEVPPGVAARLRIRGGLTTINVDQTRFPATGDNFFQSSDYGANPNSADINIDAGVTKIQVN